MDLKALEDRFGADRAEPIHVGHSSASVVRLSRGAERLYYKAGHGIGREADRLAWLGGTGFPCPRIVDRGNNWMLTTSLSGRDASQPWPSRDRPEYYVKLDDSGGYLP